MKLTKYEHACLVLEEQGKLLVIDPGVFSKSLPANLDNVVAVVITHIHPDHCDLAHAKAILSKNPDVQFYGTAEVAEVLSPIKVNIVTGTSVAKAGPFELKFYGGQHAVIHPSWPIAQNVGVMVNNKLYYPGDSFTKPRSPVQLLALPVSAPWLKLSESMDFLTSVKPQLAFPTHNALLSEAGENLVDNILSDVAKDLGAELKIIQQGSSIDV